MTQNPLSQSEPTDEPVLVSTNLMAGTENLPDVDLSDTDFNDLSNR